MRVLRATGENISPSDDASLFSQVFKTDGLFSSVTITSLGSNQVSIPALYGIIQGREFTNAAETLSVVLPGSGTATGYIYVQYDLAANPIGTLGSALAPFTPTYEDINGNGTVAQMVIATYTASTVAVTDITAAYTLAAVNAQKTVTATLVSGNWSSGMYSLETTYPSSLYDLEVELNGDSATETEIDAWASAQILGSFSANRLIAFGDVPTSDLPVMIKVVSKS